MMGVAFDNTCVLWQQLTCSDESGSCLFYDNEALSVNFVILTVTVKFVSFVAMMIAVFLYRPPRVLAHDLVTEVTAGDVDGDKDGGKVNPVAHEISDNVDEKPKVNGTASSVTTTDPANEKTDVSSNGGFAHDEDNLEMSEL
jgi:hypothetical protein